MYSNTITANMCSSKHTENCNSTRKSTKRKRRHIPHAQRTSEYVDRRNTRERNRIRAVNEAFERLRKKIPTCGQDPELRISKMEVLTNAIGYIEYMCRVLGFRDFAEYCRVMETVGMKENPPSVTQGWNAMYNVPTLPGLYPGGLKERSTNIELPRPQAPPSDSPWGHAHRTPPSADPWRPMLQPTSSARSWRYSRFLPTSFHSRETPLSRNCFHIDTYNSQTYGELQTFSQFSEDIFDELSSVPWNGEQSINSFQHEAKFNQSDCLYDIIT